MNSSVTAILRTQYQIDARAGKKCACPFCEHKKSFSIKRDDSLGKCFRPECAKFIKSDRGRGASNLPKIGASLQARGGCTLEAYAKAKRLPLAFLSEAGLSQFYCDSKPAVRMPYLDAGRNEIAIRFRVALAKGKDGDDRFRWKTGTKLCLYGLWRLEDARAAGYVVIVEGESDAQTLWFHKIPALGIPGAKSWQEAWADYLDGIARIYVVVEPDSGGEAVRKWLANSRLRERAYLVPMGSFKDPSALYLSNPEGFREAWQEVLESAIKWADAASAEAAKRREELGEGCKTLAQQHDILSTFADALDALGVVGERKIVKLIYLCVTSRVLERPVSLAVKGPSSGGKSYLVQQTMKFFPPEAFYALTAMSERSLAYSTEPLQHRMLVIYEAAGLQGEFASYLIRSLLSEGCVRYDTVEKTPQGLKPRSIEREGPTGLIITTTAINLHPENETRYFSATVTDSPEQTRRILLTMCEESPREIDFRPWHSLQLWLACGDCRVEIPFAAALAENIPPVAVRLRRDFKTLLSLIRAHALLHQRRRQQNQDGRIVAELEDYAAVRELVVDLIGDGVHTSVSKTMRETVEAVQTLTENGKRFIKVKAVADHFQLDESSALRRMQAAQKRGFLVNHEERRNHPARIGLGEPLPEETAILPTVAQVRACTLAAQNWNSKPPPLPSVAIEKKPCTALIHDVSNPRFAVDWNLGRVPIRRLYDSPFV